MNVLPAIAEDASRLSEIAYSAKAHWGYSSEWLEAWRDDLTIKPTFIEANAVFKLVGDTAQVIGFCALVEEGETLWIEHLWVSPRYIGKGWGRRLFQEAFVRARKPHHQMAKVISDPNAVGFYQKEGFFQTDFLESKPKGRMLPILSRPLVNTD